VCSSDLILKSCTEKAQFDIILKLELGQKARLDLQSLYQPHTGLDKAGRDEIEVLGSQSGGKDKFSPEHTFLHKYLHPFQIAQTCGYHPGLSGILHKIEVFIVVGVQKEGFFVLLVLKACDIAHYGYFKSRQGFRVR